MLVEQDLLQVERRDFPGGQSQYFATVDYLDELWLYKKYNSNSLPSRQRADELERLVSWAEQRPQLLSKFAFPKHVVYDGSGNCTGVLMTYAPKSFFDPSRGELPTCMEALATDLSARHEYWESTATAVLGHLLDLILDIHEGGWVIGDLSYFDVLISTSDWRSPIFLVDCDSFFRHHDPGAHNLLFDPPDGEASSDRTDLYKWALFVERFLGPDLVLKPDREPLCDEVRHMFRADQLQMIDGWKTGVVPDDTQTELETARELAHLMSDCATRRGRSVMRGGARRPLHPIADLLLLLTLFAAPAAFVGFLWSHRTLWQSWWAFGLAPCKSYLPTILIGAAGVLVLLGIAVGSAGRIYGPTGWRTGSAFAVSAILLSVVVVLAGNPWNVSPNKHGTCVPSSETASG